MPETCVNCIYFQHCDDVTDDCENEGCACFEAESEEENE